MSYLPSGSGGGSSNLNLTLYASYILSSGGSPSGSITMPEDGYVFGGMNLNYGSSGYVRLYVNDAYLINTGSKGSWFVGGFAPKGCTVSWAQNSQYPSEVAIYIISKS